jgi:hypothetical protein
MILDKRTLYGIAKVIGASCIGFTAVYGAVHKPPEVAAKASYGDTISILVEMQEAQRKDHTDVVALRAYVEEYVKEHTVIETSAPVPTDAGVPAIAPTIAVKPAAPTAPVTLKIVHVVAPASAAPPPPVAPPAAVHSPKALNSYPW